MTVLIVEDDRILADLLGQHFRLRGVEGIMLATNLQDAIERLPRADGVLCDGSFPTSRAPSPESRAPKPEFGGIRENWPHIAGLAEKRGIPFALFTGTEATVAHARECGLTAFQKPFDTQKAVEWLIEQVRSRETKTEN